MKLIPYLPNTIHKMNSEWIEYLNMRAPIIKLFADKLSVNFHEGKFFSGILETEITTKIDKLGTIKINSFSISNGTVKKMKI